ncbi:MAG TPA: hypothetical protein VGN72_01165 [Tepidisphaeraceae bacterium]|nr:hypothetical protein [Tepidisphaeraceae bacterium]
MSDERDTTGHEVRHGAAGESVPPVKVLHCPIEHSFYAERRSSRGDRGTCARCGKSKEEHFYDQKADAAPSSPAGNLYARRDIEELGELYVAHVHAMTREGLHAKGDIAAELAHRDARATRAEAERDVARAEVERLRESVRVRDAELLRIRTTQAGAAHQLENVKFALGVRRSEEQTEPAHMVAQRLRGAVEWYAEPRNYLPAAPDTSTDSYANLCSVDGYDATGMPGARARAALAPATPTTEEKGA